MDCPVPSVSQPFVSSQWGSCVSHTRNLGDTDRCTTAAPTFDLHVIKVSLLAPPLGHIERRYAPSSSGCFTFFRWMFRQWSSEEGYPIHFHSVAQSWPLDKKGCSTSNGHWKKPKSKVRHNMGIKIYLSVWRDFCMPKSVCNAAQMPEFFRGTQEMKIPTNISCKCLKTSKCLEITAKAWKALSSVREEQCRHNKPI